MRIEMYYYSILASLGFRGQHYDFHLRRKNKEQQEPDSDTRFKHIPICSPFNILATLLATLLLPNSTHLHSTEKNSMIKFKHY